MNATNFQLTIKDDLERFALKPTDFLVVSSQNCPEPACVKSIIRDMSDRLGIPESHINITCEK